MLPKKRLPIRLLCVGLGGMGLSDWSSAAKVKDFKIVAGVDTQKEARKVFEEKTGAPTFDDFTTALRNSKANAVLIATPDAYHAPYAIQAMEAGLDVICEKPMSDSLGNARRMHRTAERQGKLLLLHQQLPWRPIYKHLQQIIKEGLIGTVRQVEFDMYVFSDVCLAGYRSKLPQLMLQDLAIHHFDLMRFLTGQECKRLHVHSWSPNEEGKKVTATTSVHAILEMTGGINICYRSKIRELLDDTGYLGRIAITGSRGSVIAAEDKIRLQTFKAHANKKPARVITPKPQKKDIWQSFADSIKTRKPMWTSSGNNLKSLEMLFAAIRSVETRKTVELAGGKL
ncbi:MAG: Gfo/Idh/MocA family oxidoreductase [Kiritimatiellota bacterium]|nr:Gfo/Idh/MocA family oxidoreductase [Kiritimatiellota bacterium]